MPNDSSEWKRLLLDDFDLEGRRHVRHEADRDLEGAEGLEGLREVHLLAVDRDRRGLRRVLDLLGGDGAEELVVFADRARKRELQRVDLLGEGLELLLRLVCLRDRDRLLVRDAVDGSRGRRNGEATRDEVVARDSPDGPSPSRRIADLVDVRLEHDLEGGCHDALLLRT